MSESIPDTKTGEYFLSIQKTIGTLLTVVIGMVVSVFVFYLVSAWEQAEEERRFILSAYNRLASFHADINRHQEVVSSIARLLSVRPDTTREEFRLFVKESLSLYPEIHGLGWDPLIRHSERESFVKKNRQEGITGFRISERGADGKSVKASVRDEYVAVQFIEPLAGNEAALGFDIASHPGRLRAIEKARDTGEAVITERVKLIQEKQDSYGYLLLKAVYRGGVMPDTIEQRRELFMGVAGGVFRFVETIPLTLQNFPPLGVDLWITDLDAPPEKRFLHLHSSLTRETQLLPTQQERDKAEAGPHLSTTIDVPGRKWSLLFSAAPKFYDKHRQWQSWAASGAVLILTLMLTLYSRFKSRYISKIAKVNQELHEEIADRRKAEILLVASEQAHRNSEEMFSLLLESAAEGIYGIDTNGICTFINPAGVALLGYQEKDELLAKKVHNLIHYKKLDGNDYPLEECRIYQAFQQGKGSHIEDEVFWRKDGSSFPVEYWSHPMRQSGEVVGAVVTFFDITDRIVANMERESLLHDMDERMKELSCMYGVAEAIRKYGNLKDALQEVTKIIPSGWHYPEYTYARIVYDDMEFVDRPFIPTAWKMSSDLIVANKFRGAVEVFHVKEFPELDEGPFLRQERNLLNAIATSLSESISHRETQAEIEYIATHDSLTGLYNRKVLDQRLNNDLQRSVRYNRPIALFMLDIDFFKQINDTHGHYAGDMVLQSFARILEASIRNTDYAARYGGEEFIVVLTETSFSDARELAERLREDISRHAIPLENGGEVHITTSIGIAGFPEHADSCQGLLKSADSAMYAAKNAGRNCVMLPSIEDG